MKIVCAPDSFKESLTAVEAAEAMARGIRTAIPDAQIDRCPVGDGGDGTLESMLAARDGKLATTIAHDALGTKVTGKFGLFEGGKLAFVESASAIGMALIPAGRRDVMRASSFGAGELMLVALDRGPSRVIVGVGGSATNDGGCGMAQALGVRFLDAADKVIAEPISGDSLEHIAAIDPSDRIAFDATITVACDVSNPLTGVDGAVRVYGPQKGASVADVKRLDDGLQHLAELIRRDVGLDVEPMPGAGAAGGLGAGLVAFAGARIVSGIETVLEAIDFDARVRDADLCLTGEGRLDAQSLSGKACIGVARAAAQANVPVAALVGSTGLGAESCLRAGIEEYIVIGKGLPIEESVRRAGSLLADAAASAAGKYQ